MYLTYDEFKTMGGTLDETAFKIFNRRAEYLINAQGNGRTGDRIGKLTELPQAVKDCTFELINHLNDNAFDGSNIQSESQSLGAQSESFTYSKLSKDESDTEVSGIIFNFLYNVKIDGVSILYLGASV